MSDLVGNPEDQFSHYKAQLRPSILIICSSVKTKSVHYFRFGVDMGKFPIITRIIDECSKLEAFKKAHPFVQPDCPEDLRIKS